MSGPAWLLGLVMVMVVVGIALFELERFLKNRAMDGLDQRNAHARIVYREAGMRWYPHKLENGTVRWYEVEHDDAMDFRRAAPRG